ncbi:uncharacterized protein LOC106637508 [Copidosoma floridanum]|uniref:uncharacterized protein LOC106637508 n=1 Tax=Copidosoma floridanum TaxID=29053 RepID=UPI0006C9B266|nr:uncharacterized protein LOC106637508 [Copidosoma floridanum]
MSMIHDPHVNCPYDESHRILRSRLAFHLTRCSKNHPNAKKKQCPYDVRHLIDPVDFQHHIDTCPGRESVLHYALHDADHQARTMNILPVPASGMPEADIIPSSENWDEDQEVISYNPLMNILQKPVVRTLIGASKSEKKRFREEERKRLQQLGNELEKKEKQKREKEKAAVQKSTFLQPKMVPIDHSERETVLRRPKKQSEVLNRSMMEELEEITELPKQINAEVQDDKKPIEPKAPGKSQASQPLVGVVSNASHGAIPKRMTTNDEKELAEKTSANSQNKEIKAEPEPKKVPFSYAAALSRNNANEEKVNTTLNSSFMSCHTADVSMIDQLSQEIDSLLTTDGEDLEISRLDETINEMKSNETKESTSSIKPKTAGQRSIYSRRANRTAN